MALLVVGVAALTLNRGETVETAALREVYEASGLRARIVRPIVLHEGRLQAAGLLRSRRDVRVLRRLVEMRTGVVSIAASD
jgi:8-oxo-dGTP pyrophosphatase MutT (NUDIX family)